MQTSKKSEYTHAPNWYYNVEYLEEKERGYEFLEDLMAVGFFEMDIKKGESIVFSASTDELETEELSTFFEEEITKRTPRTSFENNLENAAQQFFIKKGKKLFVTAGFPWFGIYSRDTFISLPGLSLARNDNETAKLILDSMSKELRNGLFPNAGLGVNADTNSADAPLWYIWAIQKYVYHTDSFAGIWNSYGKQIEEIIDAYKNGKNYGITMHDNGLIYASIPGIPLTWMDAIVNGVPVTQRNGYTVEINALWYNAVLFALELAKKSRNNEFVEKYSYLPDLIQKSFIKVFWSEQKNYTADYVNENIFDLSVRPNMIFATSLPYRILNDEQSMSVLKVVENELLTPKGIRTLAPKNPKYVGIYEGNQEQRDLAYHQGTVWPWLFGHFVEGYLKLHGQSGIAFAERIYKSFEEEMSIAGLGTISELYDGNPPHEPKGAIAQAWSVAEILRIKCLIEKTKKLD